MMRSRDAGRGGGAHLYGSYTTPTCTVPRNTTPMLTVDMGMPATKLVVPSVAINQHGTQKAIALYLRSHFTSCTGTQWPRRTDGVHDDRPLAAREEGRQGGLGRLCPRGYILLPEKPEVGQVPQEGSPNDLLRSARGWVFSDGGKGAAGRRGVRVQCTGFCTKGTCTLTQSNTHLALPVH
jgi:hypothetical protein